MTSVSRAALLLLLAPAACAPGASNQSVTDRDTIAACRAHADEVYNRLNRNSIYSVTDNGAPNSSVGLVGNPTAGLSERYANDRLIQRCERGIAPSGANVAPSFGIAPSEVPGTQPLR